LWIIDPLKASAHSKALRAGGARGELRIPQGSSHLPQPHCDGSQGEGAVPTQQFQLLIIKRLKWEFCTVLTHF